MKLVHKLIIAAIGLSLLPTMCAKNSEPTESVQQQQPQPIASVQPSVPRVVDFCKVDLDSLQIYNLRSEECNDSRRRVKADSYNILVNEQEIKLSFRFAAEPDRGIVLILNRVTNEYTVINHKNDKQDELSGKAAITVVPLENNKTAYFADLYFPNEDNVLNSYSFTVQQ